MPDEPTRRRREAVSWRALASIATALARDSRLRRNFQNDSEVFSPDLASHPDMRTVLTIGCALVVLGSAGHGSDRNDGRWIGTWATAAQPARPSAVQTFRNQTLRLIVHTSVAGTKVRITFSNTFGDRPLAIGSAHIARRSSGADIDPASDRALTFRGRPAVIIP